ncbi:ABC transporter permease [Puia sp. P3]|uniref:ABC transporter permease n=1 Tax=Puia sp. P3 TaxID=3423952 RepID=UPI003D671F47
MAHIWRHTHHYNHQTMLRHFLQIALRHLQKQKFYSFINITGLAIGMACCIVITLYVYNERSYDQYHTKKDRIYRVLQVFRHVQDGEKPPTPHSTTTPSGAVHR